MRYVLLGDPHAKQDNLDETGKVVEWAAGVAREHKARLVIMGDLYDTHKVAHLSVQKFWMNALKKIEDVRPYLISGNHDMDHETSASWLDAHAGGMVEVVGADKVGWLGEVGVIPFIRDNGKFVDLANSLAASGAKYILCHQEFSGAKMDNGFYSPHGVDVTKLPKGVRFISGHIHRRQDLMFPAGMGEGIQVMYVGTPRHLTRSDVGEVKGIHVWYLGDDTLFQFVPTPREVAEPFQQYTISPESRPEIQVNSRTYVDIKGSAEFIKETLRTLPEGLRIRTFPAVDRVKSTVKESDGIPKAFMNYMLEYCNQNNLGNAALKVIAERIFKRCPSLRG